MNTKYSLTTLLSDLLKIQNNGYRIISSLSDIVSSNADTVIVDVEDANGVVQQVSIPSFGSIKNQLVRLENNQKSLSGLGETNSEIQLSDGSFRKVLISNLQKEAADISSIEVPEGFNTKENWFFESFLNPLMYISFDLTGQVKFNTERVEIGRYILNINTDDKLKVFLDNFSGNSEISYQEFIQVLIDNEITFFLDKDVIDLPPRSLRYSGDFSVTNIFDDTVSQTIDGVAVQNRVLRVKLDKLVYDDRNSEYKGTQSLKIGDSLIVNSGRQNTRFEITGIELSSRTVDIKLIEGFDSIKIGSKSLIFFANDDSTVSVDVNIGFNEYSAIFIKPIDPDSKIASVNWSPGVGIYTNDLTTRDANDQLITLSQYYQNEVVDFGSYLYSMAKEKITPAAFGVIPNTPQITSDDFKVVQINQHITDSSDLSNLQKLQEDKIRVGAQIKTLEKSINDLRTKLQTTKYSSTRLEDADSTELSKLIDEKNTQSQLFSSIVSDIIALSDEDTIESLKPKYRVRGFFPIPEPKTSQRTGDQDIIQFEYQYRYLRKNGSSNKPEQISFTENGVEKRGTFTTWIPIKSDIRKRVTDSVTGIISWADEDVENADIVNINQVDIPISSSETVEFRIRSISEAGWPTSPATSAFTDIISVTFPADLENTSNADSIIEETKRQKVVVDMNESLSALGIEEHISESFSAGNKYYAHTSTNIASGFLSAEQNIISLLDKLTSMDSEISSLRALIENTRGILNVRIVDELGSEYEVKANSVIKLFAGNYREQVSSLNIKKGVIITKNYFIKISNDAASNLELYARFFGDKYSQDKGSFTGSSDYDSSDSDYNTIRRYDKVPLGWSNPNSSDVSTYGFIRNTPEQSSQVLGQFIQSRYISIDGKSNLYSDIDGTTGTVANSKQFILGNIFSPSTTTEDLEYTYDENFVGGAGSVSAGDFIWNGNTIGGVTNSSDATVQSTYPTNILLHISHPEIINYAASGNPGLSAKNAIHNSVLANRAIGFVGENMQTALFFEGTGLPADKYSKIGFEPNDQYTIGPLSVGSYLFLNPNDSDSIRVDGNDSLSYKNLLFGTNNSIFIPFTYQYRMTDFFGEGTNGLGNIGGDPSANSTTNLFYKKTIGIDIFHNSIQKDKFSFDIEVSSRYYSKSITTKDIPARSFEVAIDDLNQTIKNITPGTSRD